MKPDGWGNIYKMRILQKKEIKRRFPKFKAWCNFHRMQGTKFPDYLFDQIKKYNVL